MIASRTLVRASRLLAMTLTCLGAVNARAEVIRHPSNPRYLKDTQTDQALFLTGFGPIVFADRSRIFGDEIDALARNSVHYSRVWTLRYDFSLLPWTIDSGPFQTGGVAWGWNDEYWERFEQALTQAEGLGIYLEVMFFDKTGTDCNGWWPWLTDHADVFPCSAFKTSGLWRELQIEWVKRILQKTKAHPNVFYEIENEPALLFGNFLNREKEWSEFWAAYVKDWARDEGVTPRLVAIDPPGDQPDRIHELEQLWSLGNIDILNYHTPDPPQSLGTLHHVMDKFGELGKVVSMDEFGNGACAPGCGDHQPGLNRIRREGWTAIGSGAHFHIEDIEGPHSNPDIVGPMLANIEAFKGHWSFWRFTPSDEPVVTSGGGLQETFCTRRGDAREYACYLPKVPLETDTIEITLPPSPAGFGGWRLQCWNPRSTVHDYECDILSRDDRHITANLPPPSEPSLDLRDWMLHVSAMPVQYHQLSLTLTGAGSGVVSANGSLCTDDCTLSFPEGTDVTLTATADAGSAFVGWVGSGCAGPNPCVVRMSADQSASARFEPLRTLTVVRTGNGRVSGPGIDCGTDCTEDYVHGTVVTLTAAANSDSTLQSWTGCDSVNGNNCIVTMDAAKTVTAAFQLRSYPFTVTRLGTGTGTVTSVTYPGIDCGTDCTETYTHYQLIRLRMVPGPGSTFVRWGGSCPGPGTQSTCDVVVNGPEAVTATFEPPAPSPALQYYPLPTPCRVVDTRPGSPLLHGQARAFQITGPCVPANATSVAAVVTAVAPTGGGNINMNGGPLALTSVANFPSAGGAWASSVVTTLTGQGQVIAMAALSGGGSTHLLIDVTGYFAAPGPSGQNFTPFATPTRLFDTTVSAGVEKLFKIGGAGFPSAPASAVALSVAAVDPPAAGHLTVYPSGAGSGGTSSLNYAAPSRLYNGTIVRLGSVPTGNLAALSTQGHRLLIDINGVFHAPVARSLQYHAIKPCRVLDTRVSGDRLAAGDRSFQVRGMCGAIPDSARAVTANFAVIGPDAQGHLAFRPTGGAMPTGGQLLYAPGWTIGSGAVLPLSSSAAPVDDLTVFTVAPTHLLVDITGYFSPAP